MMLFFDKLWRKIVFFIGDIRRLDKFPWVTWAVHEHGVGYDEILAALPLIKYGDVGIHRDAGYLSNIAIPGFMKHGWIHTRDGLDNPQIVEATSDGVLGKSALYPMFSDFTIILEPKGVSDDERKGACKKANGVIGAEYDVDFRFDIESELQYYQGKDRDGAINDLIEGEAFLRRYDHAFSCTELVSYSWWHKREDLRLYRKKSRGKSVILADDFLNGGWSIKWASKSVTVEAAQRYGLHEEGIAMIESYLQSRQATQLH